MAVQLGPEHFQHLVKQRKTLMERVQGMKERLAKPAPKIARTAEVLAGATAAGLIQGKAGIDSTGRENRILFMPASMFTGVAGLALNLLGHFDAIGEKHSHHFISLGDGFIAGWGSSMGFGAGKTWHEKGRLFGKDQEQLPAPPPATSTSGYASPEQMAEIANRFR